ncbi:hypothetical protein [Herbaspirillum chlorophenolicum]|uniref:hypothetical protein n=1 Tax=Herbaspirillum chlorophenolicum TaxID=211589 RepID=UPI00067D0492|nr:hypothetical protein [Herbaspirillum chlorophenolicum]
MQSLIHTCHYRDHEISVVGFEMLDGWHLAVQIKPEWKPAWQAWRDKERRYEDFDEVKAAGMAWAMKAIDQHLPALQA